MSREIKEIKSEIGYIKRQIKLLNDERQKTEMGIHLEFAIKELRLALIEGLSEEELEKLIGEYKERRFSITDYKVGDTVYAIVRNPLRKQCVTGNPEPITSIETEMGKSWYRVYYTFRYLSEQGLYLTVRENMVFKNAGDAEKQIKLETGVVEGV